MKLTEKLSTWKKKERPRLPKRSPKSPCLWLSTTEISTTAQPDYFLPISIRANSPNQFHITAELQERLTWLWIFTSLVEPGTLLPLRENFKGRVAHYDTGMVNFAFFSLQLRTSLPPRPNMEYTSLALLCNSPLQLLPPGELQLLKPFNAKLSPACWQTQCLSEEARKLKVLCLYRIRPTHKIHHWTNSSQRGTCQIQQGSLRAEDKSGDATSKQQRSGNLPAGPAHPPLTLESPNPEFSHFFSLCKTTGI